MEKSTVSPERFSNRVVHIERTNNRFVIDLGIEIYDSTLSVVIRFKPGRFEKTVKSFDTRKKMDIRYSKSTGFVLIKKFKIDICFRYTN